MMMYRTVKLSLLGITLCILSSCVDTSKKVYNDPTEGKLLVGATVHLGNGDIIENAVLGVKDDLITILEAGAESEQDPKLFILEVLSSQYHIYPFEVTEPGNSGIVLARAAGGSMNITILNREKDELIAVGNKAMLLVCNGSIQDASRFRVEYVMIGEEKVKILKQSDYALSPSKGG